MPWLARIALTLGVVVFGLAAPTLPGDALPGLGAPCAGAAEQTIRVGVVVDDGTGGALRIDCVTVPAKPAKNGELRATGAAVLAARAAQLGLTAPRWGTTGLMCAIDGHPASGCAEPSSAGYVYWSYWQADGNRWVYSSLGPAFRYVKDGAVEGWRYGNGGGTGQDLAPRTTPNAARCPDPVPTPVPSTAPPAPPPPAGGGTGADSTGSTGGRTGSGPGASPSPARPATRPPAGATPTVPDTTPTTPTTTPSATGEPPSDATTTTTNEAEVEGTTEERTESASVVIPGDSGGGGGWTGTAVGMGTLGAAAIGLTVLGRRRRSAP